MEMRCTTGSHSGVDACIVKSDYIPSFISNESCSASSDESNSNGLCFNNFLFPEEVVNYIFYFVEPKELLRNSLVCRKWNKMIKSYGLWSNIYQRKYNRKPKSIPWYLFYCRLSTNIFDNMLLNGNGQEKFKYWDISADGGGMCRIEDPPKGVNPIPQDVADFCNQTSCIVAYKRCRKSQQINFKDNPLFRHIVNYYKPSIYLSEWINAQPKIWCGYKLECDFIVEEKYDNLYTKPHATNNYPHTGKWRKVEITITDYPDGLEGIIFHHEIADSLCSRQTEKVAGGVMKFIFESLEVLPTDNDGNKIPKKFSQVQYFTNEEPFVNDPDLVRRFNSFRIH